ncbi:hypothetical protein HYH02_007067 [Chlamydomonas schloesseri]|uniref:Uncharacterized protein n=1 Tax=Chlamydomonas schloesseri TaxID=2026947 RepID=A0A836B5C9_9CHLO|nr:hypothetical protein HYH02_007067 [Chlamydomonas schloesseri]|eukprot:KAG2448040.1 hypothetical protein HYH02_007067 [Chlamydomonas schloesseri]
MQYPAREDNPVSAVSLEHSSWEPEQAPEPCSLDSWLRSALPEAAPPAPSSSGRDSYIMQQFLLKAPSVRRSTSGRSTGSQAADGEGAEGGGGGGKGPATPERHARMSTMGRMASVSTRSMLHATASRRHVTKLDTTKRLTAEQEQLEEQLRQELQQRKTQEEMSRRLEAKDAEERSKLSALRKELKGKDYTYDHKGEVVILNEFDPDRTPLEGLYGPAFKVAGPSGDGADANRALSPKRRGGQSMRSTTMRNQAAAEAAAAAAARANNQMSPTEMRRERDRRLASDYKKVQPRTQPSALDTLNPAGGVTLRGAGGASKSGPARPAQAGGLTREAYAKAVARKAHQAQVAAAEGGVPGTPMSPNRMQSMFATGTARSATGTDIPAGSLRAAMLSSRVSGGGAAGAGAGGARLSGGGAAGAGAGAGTGAGAAAGAGGANVSSGGGVSSAAAAVAAARAALARERARDPLAAYEDINYDPLAGARARARPQSSIGKPSTPDINISLTGANDWGAPGAGKSYEAPPALPHTKPTDRQLVETVGRGERLPRERAPLPTLAPPLSPSKAGLVKNTDRLQFTSVLAE